MDLNLQTIDQPETKMEEDHQDEITIRHSKSITRITPPLFSTASISLSLSTVLPIHLHLPPKSPSPLSNSPNKLKVPSEISSLSHLSHSSLSPTKPSFKSTFSSSPLQNHLPPGPCSSYDPSNPVSVHRSSIVWFRKDLRVHDNECLNTANNESISVLPVYCFDTRDYGKSSSGFDKTGPNRATFLIESVSDLRRNLQSRGSDLVVRIGKPEIVLVELAKAVGADVVYAHREVSRDEVRVEEKIEAAMKEEGVEMEYLWGSTLYHVDDLPFKLEEMPLNYGGFREKVEGLEVRKTIAALHQLRRLPAKGDVEPCEIPTLLDLGISPPARGDVSPCEIPTSLDLGFSPTATTDKDGKPATNASLVGGETEALQKLRKFAAECSTQPNIHGANFSCKMLPWLAMGCLSPRFMFEELKKSATRTNIAASSWKDGGTSRSGNETNWFMFELLWRDFFRFITKKYSSTEKMLNGPPPTVCPGDLQQDRLDISWVLKRKLQIGFNDSQH